MSLAIAGMLLAACHPAQAEISPSTDAPSEATLPGVTVTAQPSHQGRADIGGLGSTPAWQQPQQAERFNDQALKQAQVQRLADIVKLDASVSASYNAAGYWDFLSVRGFVLDVTHNYRREGLPINGETSLPLDNKDGVELLKGTSGMQAGVSSPGGLMNLLVKRPQERVREATLTFNGHRSVGIGVDLSDRFGERKAYGLRLNAAHERLDPSLRDAKGERHLLALAGDWRLSAGTLLEAEIEHSRRSQRSAPGFSLLGTRVPQPSSIDPRTNLNKQPWALPVMMQGDTGTLRLSHQLATDWKLQTTLGQQRLRSDDRSAFPFGGLCAPSDGFSNCDRYADNGEFSVYDFRSDGEIRLTRAWDANLSGQVKTGSVGHEVTAGALRTLSRTDVPTAAYNLVGTGNITGDFSVPADPSPTYAQVLRRERSTELYVRDKLRLSESWRAWAGLRHTRMDREQRLSDGTQPSSTRQSFTTPWLALGYEYAPMQQVYASWGEGVEVQPAKFNGTLTLTNPGQTLPAMKSRQWEAGIKGQSGVTMWSLNYFHVVRPEASLIDDGSFVYTHQLDGDSRHSGIEGRLRTKVGAYTADISAMWLDAERRRSAKPGINGKAPTNVPDYSIKMSQGWRVASLPGLNLQGDIVHEGPRTADAVNDIRIPAWTRLDASAAYVQQLSQERAITWRAGVINLLDTRAWVESPTQFDHIYLFPMAQRTATLSMQLSF
ncbi:MAG: TonB-dependent receptor [Aquabacterium sp.]